MLTLLIISSLILLYLIGMTMMVVGWHRSEISLKHTIGQKLSVVVATRNEEKHIGLLLQDLNQQTIDKGIFEVILVNDHSEDRTVEYIEKFCVDHPKMRIRLLNSIGEGKKEALRMGIENVSSMNIITTDADCRVGENWLNGFQREFSDEKIKMICGPVSYYEKNSIFSRLQSLEFAGLIGLGASGLKLNFPNMCNGANLGFRKSSYEAVGGYKGNENIASGDDEFLMHKIHKENPGSVKFLGDYESIVMTESPTSMRDFVHQRKRWASKWDHYKLSGPRYMALFIFGFYLSMLVAMVLTLLGQYPWEILIIQVTLKVGVDLIFLAGIMHFLKKRLNPFIFLLMELLYPFYVIIFGVLSNVGTYEWKGRKFS